MSEVATGPGLRVGTRTLDVRSSATLAGLTRTGAVRASVVVAALAVLPSLARSPLSWDEAVTLQAARLPLPQLARFVQHTDGPVALYYLLIHGWIAALGVIHVAPAAGMLRLPSALAALGAVAVLVRLASGWFGPRIALLAGCVFALHPMMTFYAQDARPYTLVVLVFLAGTAALQQAVDVPGTARWVRYAALVALALYLHLFVVFAVLAQAALVWRRGAWRVRLEWAAAVGAALVVASPLVVLARGQTKEISWIPAPSPGQVLSVLMRIAGGVGMVAVLIAATVLIVTRRASRPTGFVVALALVPPAALVVLDYVTPDLVARYGLVAVPALALLVAVAAGGAGRVGRVLAVAAVLTTLTTTVIQQSAPFKYEDNRAATDVVDDTATNGSAVIFLPTAMRAGYQAYSDPDGVRITDPFLAGAGAQEADPTIGGVETNASTALAQLGAPPLIFLYGDTLAQADQVMRSPSDVAKERLLRGYHLLSVHRFGDVSVSVFSR